MSPLRSLLLALLLAPALQAQLPTDIAVQHRYGQTFVTWRESSADDVRYRVYRSDVKIRTEADLDQAEFLGEVDDKSSRNQGRSLANLQEHGWVIAAGGDELDADDGLFVHTAQFTARTFYAVTGVRAGVEDRKIVGGKNATQNSVAEIPQPPRPVVQSTDSLGTLLAHWVGDRDTPYQPALSLLPSHGFNFRFEQGTGPEPRGLVVRLHAAGQTYAQGWPQRFEVPRDVDILALSDLHAFTGWTFWFGAHEALPSGPAGETRVWNYTQERILRTLDWIVAQLGSAHDPERVYVIGGSMGAIGGMYLVSEHPERFAAALLRNGNYDLLAEDYRNKSIFQTLFGSFSSNLPTRSGLPIFQRTNASFMANRDPGRDWPVIRTINGRNDDTVGWASAVGLFDGLARALQPAVHYFDDRDHSPRGYWRDLERSLLTRTFKTHRDRPSLRFSEGSMDDDPGDGERLDGDLIGTLNGYVDFDPDRASASADALVYELYVRDEGLLDDGPEPRAWAVLTPRRTAPFEVEFGTLVHFTLREEGELVDEHWLRGDARGLLVTPPVPLTRTRRVARFELAQAPTGPALWLAGAPSAGEDMQVVLFGRARAPWTLAVTLGSASGPSPVTAGAYQQAGRTDAAGIRELRIPVPEWMPREAWLWARGLIDGQLTPWSGVPLLGGAEHPARPGSDPTSTLLVPR